MICNASTPILLSQETESDYSGITSTYGDVQWFAQPFVIEQNDADYQLTHITIPHLGNFGSAECTFVLSIYDSAIGQGYADQSTHDLTESNFESDGNSPYAIDLPVPSTELVSQPFQTVVTGDFADVDITFDKTFVFPKHRQSYYFMVIHAVTNPLYPPNDGTGCFLEVPWGAVTLFGGQPTAIAGEWNYGNEAMYWFSLGETSLPVGMNFSIYGEAYVPPNTTPEWIFGAALILLLGNGVALGMFITRR